MNKIESLTLPTREQNSKLFDELKQRVENASNQPRQVTAIDPDSGLYIEFVQDALDEKKRIEENNVINFSFEPKPYEVFVNTIQNYPILLMVSLRELLKKNFELSDDNLDSKKFRDFYSDWYRENLNHHYFHEQGHLTGALQNSSLICHLGVEFYVNPEGRYNFRPKIDFDGQIESVVYKEKILNGPYELSTADKIING